MRFEVLGPLRLQTEGVTAHIDGPKQRALLAALISRAGRPASPATLYEGLWGGRLPTSPRRALTWHIRQLRKLLDRPDRLVWRQTGYVLAAEATEVDASCFTTLREAGLAAQRAGDTAHAGALFAEALGLWRGEAYADVPEHAIPEGEAARLERLRLDVLAHRVTADLTLGRHEALLPELTALSAAHPLDEGIRANLMLALHRCGRRADALEAYREGRAILVAELGLEPGPRLRRAEKEVLTDEAGPEPAAATSGPAELPAAPRTFTGRADDVAAVLDVFAAPGAVCAIAGPGGIGKSAIALHIAHHLAREFPDGQLYVDLHGTTPDVKALQPEEALRRFLRSLQGPASASALGVEELAGRFRSATAGKRLLIVLDDARDAAQVRPLLPGGPACAVVITSRRVLSTLDEATIHRLEALPDAEAIGVLARLLGIERVAAETEAAADIAGHCGGLPLALVIAAARLRARPTMPLSALAARLAAEDARLGELAVDDRAVRASFAVSLAELADDMGGGPALRLFGLLGAVDTPDMSVPAAAALADVGEREAEGLLAGLVDAQLLEQSGDRFHLHDLMRLFAKEQPLSPAEAAGGFTRILGYYVGAARATIGVIEPRATVRREYRVGPSERAGTPPSDRTAATRWVQGELDNLRAVMRQAVLLGDETATTLAHLLTTPLDYIKELPALREIGDQALAIAESVGDRELMLVAHRDLAEVLVASERADEALPHLAVAREAARLMADRHTEAILLGLTDGAHSLLDRHAEALDAYARSVELARECGLEQTEGATLNAMGHLLRQVGDLPAALDAQQRAQAIAERLGSPHGQALTSSSVAGIHMELGNYREAAEHYGHAIVMNREAGQEEALVAADYAWGLAEALYAMGRVGEALASWGVSLDVLHRFGAITADERESLGASEHPRQPDAISLPVVE
ncbi:AfsR/SARP family transcriptional regulator [Phytomonospora endophytica]|uniref:DNA-binding SARP family transcriptional activator n=1 Tax=Phytomonospora endophytica TaxID=714109 RepID=A0A841FPY5_9ACTN|nr:BTAD domain-containing putative transcriptional regulator [Phytomonospora endophytica]MBB6037894.1 DNA-binding SARP family transcriptional activator [Phytomonospora endophytica]GIG68794.1 regulatory protein AfsR [Phytomonospora endophytica]